MSPQDKNGRIELLYQLVQQMREETNNRFDRLEARLDRRLDNHGDRISKLEKDQAHMQGKVTTWSAIIATGVSVVSKWLFPGNGVR